MYFTNQTQLNRNLKLIQLLINVASAAGWEYFKCLAYVNAACINNCNYLLILVIDICIYKIKFDKASS